MQCGVTLTVMRARPFRSSIAMNRLQLACVVSQVRAVKSVGIGASYSIVFRWITRRPGWPAAVSRACSSVRAASEARAAALPPNKDGVSMIDVRGERRSEQGGVGGDFEDAHLHCTGEGNVVVEVSLQLGRAGEAVGKRCQRRDSCHPPGFEAGLLEDAVQRAAGQGVRRTACDCGGAGLRWVPESPVAATGSGQAPTVVRDDPP